MGPVRAIERIQQETAEHFEVELTEVLGFGRTQTVARARKFAAWLARRRLDCSYPELGAAFRRDHTTVLSACRSVDAALATGESWAVVARERFCGLGLARSEGRIGGRVRVA